MNQHTSTQVLLVDDSEADFGIVQRYLRRAETGTFTLEWAVTCDEALDAINTQAVDICLVDYKLGTRNGLDVLDAIQETQVHVPVIFLTGLGNVEVAMEAMKRGALDYLDKNELTTALLERSIRYTIENFQVREQLRVANETLEERVRARTTDLERSNRELEEFASLVSHEFELPLQTITAEIEKLRDQQHTRADSEESELAGYFLTRAHTSAVRMQELLRTVLTYSRVGRRTNSFSQVSLNELLDNVLDDLDDYVRGRDARIERGPMPQVWGDACLLRRLFQNLIHNALKYTPERPIVHVWGEENDGGWRCGVRDNGAGLAHDELEKVFNIFHRAPRDNTAPGHGIGLALCKRIVEYHGGRIWVESQPETGATFLFTLGRQELQRDASVSANGHAGQRCGEV